MSKTNIYSASNKGKPALNVTDILNYSASLVEKLGKSKLSNGKTLAEALTLEGIPLWDVFPVEFAHSHLPTLLAAEPLSESIMHQIRPYLSRLKHGVHDFVSRRRSKIGCSSWPAGKTVLCLGFTHQMYRDVLQPVVARLAMRADCDVVVLSDGFLPEVKASLAGNCKYQTVWQHWNEQAGTQVSKLQRLISRSATKQQFLNALPQIIPDKDLRLLTNFKKLFNWFFRVSLPRILPHAVLARHILETHRPALVIASDTADSRARVYSVLCRLMGIPYLDIQFGLTGDEAIEWRFLAADRVAVWGDSSKEAVLKQKVSEDRIIITGSPRYDSLVNIPESEVRAKRLALGVPENSAMVVLASTYTVKTHSNKYSDPGIASAMQRAISEAAVKTPGIFLVVKPHPLENVRDTQAFFSKSPNILFAERQSDIRELIKMCDAFLSYGSTATLDALVADKLTICPVFPGWSFSDVFKNSGATLVPASGREILEIFGAVASGTHHNLKAGLEPARQSFLNRYVYRADGMAAARIENIAVKMAGIA